MRVIQIFGETEKTRHFTPCTFTVTIDGRVFTESQGMGFFERTEPHFDLERHLDRMREEGFTVTETVTV